MAVEGRGRRTVAAAIGADLVVGRFDERPEDLRVAVGRGLVLARHAAARDEDDGSEGVLGAMRQGTRSNRRQRRSLRASEATTTCPPPAVVTSAFQALPHL